MAPALAALTFVDFHLGDVSHGSGNCLPSCHNTRNSALSHALASRRGIIFIPEKTRKHAFVSVCYSVFLCFTVRPPADVRPQPALLPASRRAGRKSVVRKKKGERALTFFCSSNLFNNSYNVIIFPEPLVFNLKAPQILRSHPD